MPKNKEIQKHELQRDINAVAGAICLGTAACDFLYVGKNIIGQDDILWLLIAHEVICIIGAAAGATYLKSAYDINNRLKNKIFSKKSGVPAKKRITELLKYNRTGDSIVGGVAGGLSAMNFALATQMHDKNKIGLMFLAIFAGVLAGCQALWYANNIIKTTRQINSRQK